MRFHLSEPLSDVLDSFQDRRAKDRQKQLNRYTVETLEGIMEKKFPNGVDYHWLQQEFRDHPDYFADLMGFQTWEKLLEWQDEETNKREEARRHEKG